MAGAPRLEAEWLRGWGARTEAAVAELMRVFRARFGYPPGPNAVAWATEASHRQTDALVESTPVPSDLTTLYWVFGEISLPDVHVGFFVHDAAKVAEDFAEYGEIPIDGEEEPALVFGSDGGGHLFALAGSGRVWRSATASPSGRFDLVAADLQDLLEGVTRQIHDQLS